MRSGCTDKPALLEEKKEIAEIFTRDYYEQTFVNGVSYASHLMLRIFEGLGILDLLKAQRAPSDDIIAKFNFIPSTKYALEWMLSFLSQEGFLKSQEAKDGKSYFYDRTGPIEPEAFLQKGLELDKGIMPTSSLMEYVLSEYPAFFTGRKSGLEILFSGEKSALWNAYFSNDNSGYRVYNLLGALGVWKWISGRNNLRFLEVGGGTGGASAALIDKLKEHNSLSLISEYIFSDVSAVFLRLGNREIMNRVGEDFNYSLKKLDFEKPLAAQGIKEGDLDVVYGVNTLHAAKDLVGALKNIHSAIKPGGMIILCEYCRPSEKHLLLQEFIFNLLDTFVRVNLDSYLRPVPGFLDYEHWKRNLEAAGFINIEAIFNTDGGYAAVPKADILAVVLKGEK